MTQDLPRPILEHNADIPQSLVEIIDCLLQENPDHRFQLAERLVAVLGESPGAFSIPLDELDSHERGRLRRAAFEARRTPDCGR